MLLLYFIFRSVCHVPLHLGCRTDVKTPAETNSEVLWSDVLTVTFGLSTEL